MASSSWWGSAVVAERSASTWTLNSPVKSRLGVARHLGPGSGSTAIPYNEPKGPIQVSP